jgi:hypothetical protein
MTQGLYGVIIVFSTSHALRIERLLQGEGITCKLIPVPRQISSNCGVCVRIHRSDIELALQAITGAQIQIEGIHDI